MTANYAKLHLEKTSRKMTKNLAHHLLAFDNRPASKLTIDWSKRLTRTFAEVLNMPLYLQYRAGFIAPTSAEIKSVRDMGTYDSDEVLDEAHMKFS